MVRMPALALVASRQPQLPSKLCASDGVADRAVRAIRAIRRMRPQCRATARLSSAAFEQGPQYRQFAEGQHDLELERHLVVAQFREIDEIGAIDQFTMLVERGEFVEQQAPARDGIGWALVGDHQFVADRVAGPHGYLEVHAVNAGRGTRDARFQPHGAQTLFLGKQGVNHQAMTDADRVPAAGHQTAKMTVLGCLGIKVEVLRVIQRGEADDLVGVEGVAAQHKHLIDDDILEPAGHVPAPGVRVSTRLARRMLRTEAPFWLRMSNSSVTIPHCGWLPERRRSTMVTVPPMVSLTMTGFFHFRSENPSPPAEAIVLRKLSTSMRRPSPPVCQPLAARPPSRLALAAVSSR